MTAFRGATLSGFRTLALLCFDVQTMEVGGQQKDQLEGKHQKGIGVRDWMCWYFWVFAVNTPMCRCS